MSTILDIGAAAGAGVANNVMDIAFGNLKQKQQLKGQKKALEQQNEAQMDMWRKTNYSAQREELEKAGLNAGLLYGMSGGGGTTTGSGSAMPAPNTGGHGMDIAGAAQLALLNAQKENIEADTANKKANTVKTAGVDTQLATANIGLALEATNKAKAETKVQESVEALNKINYALNKNEYDYKERTLEDRITQVGLMTETLDNQLEIVKNDAQISTATKDDVIKQAAAQLAQTYADIGLKKAQTSNTQQLTAESEQKVKTMIFDVLVDNFNVQKDRALAKANIAEIQNRIKNANMTDAEKAAALAAAATLSEVLDKFLNRPHRPAPVKGFGGKKY